MHQYKTMVTETQNDIEALQKELEQAKQQITVLENQVASQKAHSQPFFDMIDDGVLILKNNEIIDCNTKTVQLLKAKNKNDIISLRLHDLSHPTDDSSPQYIDTIITSVLQSSTPLRFRWIARRQDNTKMTLSPSL